MAPFIGVLHRSSHKTACVDEPDELAKSLITNNGPRVSGPHTAGFGLKAAISKHLVPTCGKVRTPVFSHSLAVSAMASELQSTLGGLHGHQTRAD